LPGSEEETKEEEEEETRGNDIELIEYIDFASVLCVAR
jgi:hypothetical protein